MANADSHPGMTDQQQLKLSKTVAMGASVPYAMFDHGLHPLTIVSTSCMISVTKDMLHPGSP